MVFLRHGDASANKTGLALSRASPDQKITPRASRQHLIDPPSPPTHGIRCCSGCQLSLLAYCSQLSIEGLKAGRRALPAGPCTTTLFLYLRLRDVHGLDSFGPHQWHSGYHRQTQERNQSCSLETYRSLLKYEVELPKEAIVRGTARQAPSYFPTSQCQSSCVEPTQTPKMNGLNPKKKQLQVVLET